MTSPRISVIIPAWNEERQIAGAIASARDGGNCEIIVCDGGSRDRTIEQCQAADQILQTARGRAAQQNAGAQAAQGEILLFLHADCRLPHEFDSAVEQALRDPKVVGGGFEQAIDAAALFYRSLEWGNATRIRCCGWIYGDQGLFVLRRLFNELGGFPDVPLMEDLYFSKRLKRAGRLAVIRKRLQVSARRWEQQGVLRQTLRNWSLIAAAHAGVPLSRLAKFYCSNREVGSDPFNEPPLPPKENSNC